MKRMWVCRRSLLAKVVLPLVLAGVNPAVARAGYWAVQPVNGDWTTTAAFSGVSCSSSSQCIAVGTAPGVIGFVSAFANVWSGSTWGLPVQLAASASSSYSFLNGVSCVSSAFCTAVGHYLTNTSSDTQTAWAVNWNGSAWSTQTAASAVGTGTGFEGVSCSSSSMCMAVGWQGRQTLAEAWDGTTWIVEPTPSMTQGASLSAVSCASASSCMAVGAVAPQTASTSPLAERWDGSGWTVVPVPLPAGGHAASLEGVSCSAPDSCMAVGSYLDSSGNETPFSAAWSGTAFVIKPTALLSGSLSGVSCRAANWCIAVGEVAGPSYSSGTLAERWDGASWTKETTPNADPTIDFFNGVSCVSLGQCEAVGGAGSNNQLLAEQRTEPVPLLSGARLSHRRFRTPGGQSRGVPVGTHLRFNLSTAANLTIEVVQLRSGTRRAGKCLSARAQRKRTCTRLVLIGTVLRKRERQGRHRLAFSGRIGRLTLAPGHYRMLIVASAPAHNAVRVQLPFSIAP